MTCYQSGDNVLTYIVLNFFFSYILYFKVPQRLSAGLLRWAGHCTLTVYSVPFLTRMNKSPAVWDFPLQYFY